MMTKGYAVLVVIIFHVPCTAASQQCGVVGDSEEGCSRKVRYVGRLCDIIPKYSKEQGSSYVLLQQ